MFVFWCCVSLTLLTWILNRLVCVCGLCHSWKGPLGEMFLTRCASLFHSLCSEAWHFAIVKSGGVISCIQTQKAEPRLLQGLAPVKMLNLTTKRNIVFLAQAISQRHSVCGVRRLPNLERGDYLSWVCLEETTFFGVLLVCYGRIFFAERKHFYAWNGQLITALDVPCCLSDVDCACCIDNCDSSCGACRFHFQRENVCYPLCFGMSHSRVCLQFR